MGIKREFDGIVSGTGLEYGTNLVLLFDGHQEFKVVLVGDGEQPAIPRTVRESRELVGRRVRVTVEVLDEGE